MMITIHGLPPKTTFQAVKALVKQECNIIDFILDNLVDDGPNSKKVRIGVSDDAEGYRIAKCLNGFRMSPSHLLKIVPVGKSIKPPPEQSYDQRSGFSTQPRNDYPSQSRPDYQNQPIDDYGSRGPHTDTRKGSYVPPNQRHLGPHGALDSRSSESLRPSDVRPHIADQRHGPVSHGAPEPQYPVSQGAPDVIRSQQWAPNPIPSNNQWTPQAQSHLQGQNTYNQRPAQAGFGQQNPQAAQDPYAQGRGTVDQGYGYQPKTNVPERAAPQREARQHVLREVDIVETVRAAGRPYAQDKPITIMKDNFQGPTEFASGQPSLLGNYPGQGQASASTWSQAGPQSKPQPYEDRRHPPLEKRPDVPKRGHFIPIGEARPLSPVRRSSPTRDALNAGRNYQDSGRRMSPGRSFTGNEQRVSPASRLGPDVRDFPSSRGRISPTGRKISPPGRRMSPTGRRGSPTGRRGSPTGRRGSPTLRRGSPTGRRGSPTGRRVSPTGRRVSPIGRRTSPGRRDDIRRISPNDRRMGRRESPHRFSPKTISPTRRLASPPRPVRFSPSRLGNKPADKFMDSGKGTKLVRPAYEPTQAQNQTYTGGYRPNVHENVQYGISGRQPERREPSWQADKIMYPSVGKNEEERRGDASPARSPRRERSPLKERYRRHSPSPRSSRSPRRSWALEKRSSPDVSIREPPPPPVWPGQETETKPRKSRFDDEPKHSPVWDRHDRRPDEERSSFETKLRARTDSEDKFAPSRREFDDRRDYREDAARKQLDRVREYNRGDDRAEFSKRESPRRDDKKVFSDIDKDFQDIYKRAVEFRKKTEERKSGERRHEEYDGGRREDDRPFRRADSPRHDRDDFHKPTEWNIADRKRIFLSPSVKIKRDKAVDEITTKILSKYEISSELKFRVMEELKVTLSNIFLDMYSDKDVSFIELVIKYQSKYAAKEEEKLMQDVLSRLPSQYRSLKRKAAGDSPEVSKTPRLSPPARNPREEKPQPKLADAVIPDWNIGLEPPKVITLPLVGVNTVNPVMNLSNPIMVPPPVYVQQHGEMTPQHVFHQTQQLQYNSSMLQQQQHFSSDSMQQQLYEPAQDTSSEFYNLYLCQDDFEPFSELQAEYLKNFLVKQIVKVTETSNGWAPDITLKGLQSLYRYELSTKDEMSKDWVLNLNFGEFEFFNVLVYTKEELWYERAAIWLPGHSRSRNIEPMKKLRLQNKRLEGVNIERRHVHAKRQCIPTDRKRDQRTSFKRTVTVAKKPTFTRTVVREIVKNPVIYGKTDSHATDADTPVKKKPEKPEAPKITEFAAKEHPVQKVYKKKAIDPPSLEPSLGGHYELSPLLSKMLEVELEDVMTKIRRLLPANPEDGADKLVVERFRNRAGNDLRDTLGLNITKRLLNVHNPLYVKLVFSEKPLRVALVNFIKEYNISSFKNVSGRGYTYAAKMSNFQDFDELCTSKNLKCGRSRVTVTPCYQFKACPANLRTRYNGIRKSTGDIDNDKNIVKSQPVTPASHQAESQEATKLIDKNSSIQQNLATANKQSVPQKEAPAKPNESSANKVAASEGDQAGSVTKVAPKVTPDKVPATENKQDAAKVIEKQNLDKVTPFKQPTATQSQNSTPKVTPAEQSVATQAQNSTPKVTSVKPQVSTQGQNSPAPKVTPTKLTAANKHNVAPKVNNQNAAPKATPAKPAATANQPKVSTQSNQVASASKPSAAPKATITKPVVETKQKTTPKAAKPKQISPNKKKHEDDFDELDDHDILALISGGIVLDECSGSDED